MLSGSNPQQQGQAQDQSQSDSGINFGLLHPLASNLHQGVVGRAASTESGINQTADFLSGLGKLVQGVKDGLAPKTQADVQPTTNQGLISGYVSNQLGMTGQSNTGQSTLGQQVTNSGIFNNALKELGMNASDPTLGSYLAKANPGLDPTQTPWCAGFVGSVLNASGTKGTGSLAAKSYLNYGQPVDAKTASTGDIVVFNDLTGRNDPAHGHVGFVQSIDAKNGMVRVLGGNQSGGVNIKEYPLTSVAGFRRPPTGQQIADTAQQNGIQTPGQLANLPNQINQSQGNNVNPQFTDHSLPRGVRNNNPGNLEIGQFTQSLPGYTQGADSRFASFQTPEQGLGALSTLLTTKYNGQSLNQIISHYAPSSENDTQSYIDNLSKSTGLDPNKPVDMSNPDTRQKVMQGIVKIENGNDPYTAKQYNAAIGMQSASNKPDSYPAGQYVSDANKATIAESKNPQLARSVIAEAAEHTVAVFNNAPTIQGLVKDVTANNLTNPLDIAKSYVGLNNMDPKAADTIAAVIQKGAGNKIDPTTSGYCGLFVDSILRLSGRAGLNGNSSREWEAYGQDVVNPSKGDLALMNGHIGFYAGQSPGKPGYVRVLGGNQAANDGDPIGVNIIDVPAKAILFKHPPQGDKLKTAAETLQQIVGS
jgi:uncharacterized protein (TIGR02594 family)